MPHLYFNEESDYSEENTSENEVFPSTILHHREKLNRFKPQLPIYYIQHLNKKSLLVLMPDAATGGFLWKNVFFKIL